MSTTFTEKEIDRIGVLKQRIKEDTIKKLDELPKELSDALKTHCILTGGVTASVAHWEEPNDYDFYVLKKIMVLKLEGLIKKNPELIADVDARYIEKYIDGKCITANAITLVNGIQIITRGTFEEMHKIFDYVHCQPYYDFMNDKFFISKQQFHAILQKKLIKNPNGVSEEDREQKFKDRGWKL